MSTTRSRYPNPTYAKSVCFLSEMALCMTISEMKALPISERMHLMEELWDSLCHETELPESPSWHGDVLEERMQSIRSGQARFLTLQDLKNNNQ